MWTSLMAKGILVYGKHWLNFVLIQQGLYKTLLEEEGKAVSMKNDVW